MKILESTSRAIPSLLAAFGVICLIGIAVYNCISVGNEDVVILNQYSRNLAETGAISYIPNGPPAEGATDFLWMLYIAAGLKLHIASGVSTALANVLCLISIAVILLKIARREVITVKVLTIVGVLSLLPAIQASLRGFAVLPFGFMIALNFYYVHKANDVGASLAALGLCLLRPDGVVFAIPMLVVLLATSVARGRTFLAILALYIAPGIGYFLWRWHYFKQLLPLPFLVKSSGHRVLGLFIKSSIFALLPSIIFAIAAVMILFYRRKSDRKSLALAFGLLAVPIAFYANIVLLQNKDHRYFFFVPLTIALLVARVWDEPWLLSKKSAAVAGIALYAVLFLFMSVKGLATNAYDLNELKRQASIATDLSTIQPHGTMLTSEAGIMPYYSRWIPYDAYGLDSPEFARLIIQPGQVTALQPDVTILHGTECRQTLDVVPAQKDRSWDAMVANVESGLAATRAQYEVWKVPTWSPRKQAFEKKTGAGEDFECWFLAKQYPGVVQVGTVLRRYGGFKIADASGSDTAAITK